MNIIPIELSKIFKHFCCRSFRDILFNFILFGPHFIAIQLVGYP